MKCCLKIDYDWSFSFYNVEHHNSNDITTFCYFLHQEFSDVVKLYLYPPSTSIPHIIHGYETINRRMKMKRTK
jgi:hypothetical protein